MRASMRRVPGRSFPSRTKVPGHSFPGRKPQKPAGLDAICVDCTLSSDRPCLATSHFADREEPVPRRAEDPSSSVDESYALARSAQLIHLFDMNGETGRSHESMKYAKAENTGGEQVAKLAHNLHIKKA